MLTLAAAAVFAGSPTLDKAAVEAYVRHLFLWGPQIQVKVGDPKPSPLPDLHELKIYAAAGGATIERTFYVSSDGGKLVQGRVFELADHPFRAEMDKLRTDSDPGMGTPGAPVTLMMFTDFQCPYCKDEALMLRKNLLEAYPTQVSLYFKDYPLEQIHKWAKPASIAGRCVFRQAPPAFWEYHDWIFERQSEITLENLESRVMEFAREKELDALQLKRCLDTRATEEEVNRSIAEGRALEVNSTPTLFVNGRRLAGKVGWQQLRGIIDLEIEYRNKAGKGDDKECCEVKLPWPAGS